MALSLSPASGTGKFFRKAAKSIRMLRVGCSNRPVYQIAVIHRAKRNSDPVIEQLGTFDPMPNINNEKLVALNLERIKFWLGQGAHISRPTAELFGLAGFLPIHPRCYMVSWRNRQRVREKLAKEEEAKSSEAKSA